MSDSTAWSTVAAVQTYIPAKGSRCGVILVQTAATADCFWEAALQQGIW